MRDTRSADPDRILPAEILPAELCAALFAPLPRRDQRRRGMDYLYGLLTATGRKSIRNIAGVIGGPAAEQSLHHFVCDSTWDWMPVRQALAEYVIGVAPPQAWVVRPVLIPKAGEHSVGVDRRFFPGLGQVGTAQLAMGVWLASEQLCSPVNWRLHLPDAWLDDSRRRSRAAIPEGAAADTPSGCAVNAFLDLSAWDLPVRPVVLDARELDVHVLARGLGDAGVPLLARIDGEQQLCLPGLSRTLSARQIMSAARHTRRRVEVPDTDSGRHTRLVATASVVAPHRHDGGAVPRLPQVSHTEPPHPGAALAGAVQSGVVRPRSARPGGAPVSRSAGTADAGGPDRELLLMGISGIGEARPGELWLTNLNTPDLTALVRLTRLLRLVDEDFADVSDDVGMRDFTGRSFSGWHRHTTLASAACAVSILTERDRTAARGSPAFPPDAGCDGTTEQVA
ncbi:IS701 family transposase [Microbispora amethystogenes]|uniref:ISXo8 transposase n=1 Tax=Microbispora amethystogenes TaxID=1427754 RepID=A0ABQ4FP61_9ACTN|nr:transposase [Microbispora amethystogenes]GIH36613.1 putative ISXo8 transposase [Microbispora amethystogenes]